MSFKLPKVRLPSSLLTLLALALCLTHTTAAFRPGLLAFVPKVSLAPVTKRALGDINPLISHLEIDQRFELGIVTLKGFDLDVVPLVFEQIEFNFADRVDAIEVTVKDLRFRFRSAVDICIWGFVTKGWILAQGKVAKITFSGASHPFTDKYRNRPFVSLSFKTLDLRPEDLDIHADVDWVPDFVMNQIMKFIKGNVVEAVRHAVLDWLNKDFTPNINDFLMKEYPESLTIDGTDYSLQIALTDPFYFNEAGMFFPMDGTLFPTRRGYHRTEDALPITTAVPNGHTFEIYFSEYSGRSFFATIAGETNEFKITNFEASVTSLDEKVDLTFHEKGAHFRGVHSRQSAASSKTSLHFDTVFSGFLRPSITKKADGFVLNVEVSEGKLDQMKLQTNSTILASMSDLFPSFIENYFQVYPVFSIPMPDIDLFGVKWVNWAIEARENHFRIGITI